VSNKSFFGKRLGQYVRNLILRSHRKEPDEAILNVFTEVVILDVLVLGSGSHIVNLSDFKRSRVILKCLAMDARLL